MTNTVKTVVDNDEFEKQRTAAIAEVAKSKEVRMHVLQRFTLIGLVFLSISLKWQMLSDVWLLIILLMYL